VDFSPSTPFIESLVGIKKGAMVDLDYTSPPQNHGAHVLSFHKRPFTTDNLAKRGIFISTTCSLCGGNLEIAAHIFFIAPSH